MIKHVAVLPSPGTRARPRGRWIGVVVLLLAGAAVSLSAQSLYDPSDRLYRHLAIWEQRGYFAPLPALRPYAPQLVVELLQQVAAAGRTVDRELAAGYLQELAPADADDDELRLPPIALSVYSGLTTASEPAEDRALFGGSIESTSLFGLFAYSAAFSYWWESVPDPVLRYRPPYQPVFPHAGPNFSLGDADFKGREDLRAMAAFGSPRLYLQGGFAQGAFGSPLYDGVVLGAGAPPTAHLAGVFHGDRITYTASLMELVAEQAVRKDGTRYSLKGNLGETGFPSKYLMLHSLQWHALPWLSLDVFSVALFGARLSLYSLLPMGFVTEPFTKDYDNTLAGGAARVRLPGNLHATATLIIDDYNLFVGDTFNPSPFANKTAGQAALSWTPPEVTGMVSLDYLFVAPYTYTHSSHQPINYLTYTHRKQPLANALEPNSDQWTLAAVVTPLAWLDLELTGRVIRHGNASDPDAGDGSIWDDGYDAKGRATFVGPSPFLAGVLEHVYQWELAVTGRLPVLSFLEAEVRLSYRVERIDNLNLKSGARVARQLLGLQFAVSL